MCQRCQKFEFVKDVHTCEDCGEGRWPVRNYSSCYDLELQVKSGEIHELKSKWKDTTRLR